MRKTYIAKYKRNNSIRIMDTGKAILSTFWTQPRMLNFPAPVKSRSRGKICVSKARGPGHDFWPNASGLPGGGGDGNAWN